MVSSLLVEALSSPTDVLLSFYDTYDHRGPDGFPKAVSKHFSDIFRTKEAFSEVHPSSNTGRSYNDRALVRFRALVQDTSLSPEIYLSRLRDGKCGGWGMTETSQGDSDDSDFGYNHLRDCVVLWAVSVPGETEWYQSASDGHSSARADQLVKPPRAHKYPIPGGAHYGVQIKMYGDFGNDIPKTTDVLNFVGILSNEPLHADSDESIIAPTLHVLFVREHRLHIFEAFPDPAQRHIRKGLLSWIAEEALGGDHDAAEWVLLTCVARVQSRTRSLNPPSLTLSHFPPPTSSLPTPPTLFHLLSLILPLQVTLSLSLDLLNSAPFVPESVNEDLHSGYLQLAQGTAVLMTESGIEEGKLIERGVLNVQAIQQVIDTQTVVYKFPFSEFSFPTDINFVILAEGTKSALFQTDVTFPLNPPSTSDLYKPKSDIKVPSTDKLEAFRRLILDAKAGDIEVTDAISEHIQEDFVRQRKTDNAMSPEDLKQNITLARLICLTMRESSVTIDGWEWAKELNKRRMARFA
ncbi:mini-chromosome maintenance replisome factor-domain-containing protein [Lactarius quietus]|nr:mini-chromosome maintenance replisome factor-domain-containing protein [Lactarius quietus]